MAVSRVLGLLMLVASGACSRERPVADTDSSGPVTCESLAGALRRQFSVAHVTSRCTEGEIAADIEVADSSLAGLSAEADSAAAELIARSVWARGGIPLRLTAIMVTLSARPLADDEPGTVNMFGRSWISYWEPVPADTAPQSLRSR